MALQTIVKVVGVLMMCEAGVFLLQPAWLRWVIRFFLVNSAVRVLAAFSTAVGLVLLLAAPGCARSWALAALGVFLCAGGLILYPAPGRLHRVLSRLSESAVIRLRMLAAMELFTGALMYWAA